MLDEELSQRFGPDAPGRKAANSVVDQTAIRDGRVRRIAGSVGGVGARSSTGMSRFGALEEAM
ncbi:hypothetical protein BJ970_005428 [Saccharopolyspora phatthalungensis]|uniref:Uncharacterized protein n=1 Tax=Saccharopolyspora phatthalungensis TaxID=664693 RepID=A0A840QAV1_9PSEU|nr:hypothetical protein [Saccharopolyspora phatthalungensis]